GCGPCCWRFSCRRRSAWWRASTRPAAPPPSTPWTRCAAHEGALIRLSDRIATRYPVLFAMREAVGLGLGAIRAYKMRAGLTILGVVMGIMTVIGMSAIVAGLNESMAKQIEGLGSSVIFIRPQAPGEQVSMEERR